MVETTVREQRQPDVRFRLDVRFGPSAAPALDRSALGAPAVPALRRLDHARQVLDDARAVIERGWLQHGWYVVQTPPLPAGRRLLRSQPVPVPDDLGAACLVAAVAVAAHSGGSRPDVVGDAGPVIDIVWDALQESTGRAGRSATGRAAPREVRVSRMRDLVHWNDAAGRTRRDVLELVDRSISRTIMAAMSRG